MSQTTPWLPDDYMLPMTIIPACLAIQAIVGLMIAMGTRNFGFLPLLTTYLATLTTVAVLSVTVTGTFNVLKSHADLHREARRLSKDEKVELKTGLGPGANVALIGGAVALGLFWVSLLLMHRSAFGRILCVVFVVFTIVLGGVMVLTTAPRPAWLGGDG